MQQNRCHLAETNWKGYLPPISEKLLFFSELYTKQELNNGKTMWLDHIFNPEKVNRITMQKYGPSFTVLVFIIS